VQYYQTLFELLAKQYEIARSQEAAEVGLIQVLDRAIVPDKKSGPHRTLIVLVTAFLASLLAIVGAFLMEATARARNDPEKSTLVDELVQHINGWRRHQTRKN
jgi:uncharacterized protein involved in exopolysaccharide biosynthesis